MTKPVECKTARRIMPVSEWPSEDRAAWETALLPGDDLEEGGIRASHSEFSNSSQAKDYGRWLAWLKSRDLLDPHAAAVDRITRDRIRSFLADLAKHNSTATIINRLTGLKAVATVLDPEGDWAWINRAVSFVRARHRPARPKLHRIVDAKELFDFALREMDRRMAIKAVPRDFTIFRDHLMIATLACLPLRLRNFAGLTLGRTLVQRDGIWWVQVPAAETKTKKDAIEEPLPRELSPYIDFYLLAYRRPLLLKSGSLVGEGPLWLTHRGTGMSRHGIYWQISTRTLNGLGRRMTPHLFRDSVVTSIAISDPSHIGIALKIVGDRSWQSLERHYNQARGIEANRLVRECLLSLRA